MELFVCSNGLLMQILVLEVGTKLAPCLVLTWAGVEATEGAGSRGS